MPDEPVDGFADVPANENQNQGSNVQTQDPHEEIPGPPDPGIEGRAPEPLSPEEYARLEKEIKEGDQEGHQGRMPEDR